ncbi:transporter [Novosphingobium sp.]|uniref:transporter n=1 Tax=Novosphingobium sp. TaxID=1874826 RepID=UPI002B469CBA|nr:transporter [Novosphingobium sp.]HKR91437.1 transporter [Novosphingobium sp.]
MAYRSRDCRKFGLLLALACVDAPYPALAGPPFLTDDPEPTDTGHWEIYAPMIEAEGRGAQFEGTSGVELNYGAARDLQLTASLPLAYARDTRGWRAGAGDIKLSAKYRFFHDGRAGLQVAVFPGLTVPTATNAMGAGRVTALLPVWVQKDAGRWSIFGGGGYAINPGPGNRNYWTGGIAVTRRVSNPLLLGAEADRQGADTNGGGGSTSLGLGAIWQLKRPFRLLASGGPTFDDRGGAVRFHIFLALGLDI